MTTGPAPSGERDWFERGLRFECTQCGNCCTGPPGWVWFDEDEGRRMARLLGVDERDFYERYAHRVHGRWSLRERRTEHGYDCIFLDRTSSPGRAACSIYEARPVQCRTWPFWPENLSSKRAWVTTRRSTPCPGMDQGPLIPAERIRVLRDATE